MKTKEVGPHEMRPLHKTKDKETTLASPIGVGDDGTGGGKETTLDPLLDWIPDQVGDKRRG